MKTHAVLTAIACLTLVMAGAGPRALAHNDHDHGKEVFAAGEPGDPAKPARTVSVTLEEKPDGSMTMTPARLDVKLGDQIRFDVRNAGKATHEFMLDSVAHNAKHKLAMQKNPEMEHDDPDGKTLDAGASTMILWRFSKPGSFEFACLIPGHYEAGMHGTVTVRK